MTIIIDTYLALVLAMGVWIWSPVREAVRALATRKPKRMRPWPGRRISRPHIDHNRCHEARCVAAGRCFCHRNGNYRNPPKGGSALPCHGGIPGKGTVDLKRVRLPRNPPQGGSALPACRTPKYCKAWTFCTCSKMTTELWQEWDADHPNEPSVQVCKSAVVQHLAHIQPDEPPVPVEHVIPGRVVK